jgi:hypothetical protein
MGINKKIYNQTEHKIRVNHSVILPGGEMDTTSSQVDIYQTPHVFYRMIDNIISQYAMSDDFIIFLTDQHGFIDRPYFADTTVFMSVDTGKCCMYLAKTSDPIIDPLIYFYNKSEEPRPRIKKSLLDRLRSLLVL